MEYLHSKNIVHRDIRPENIVIGGKGEARLCGFGFANMVDKPCLRRPAATSYLAPEILTTKVLFSSIHLALWLMFHSSRL